MLADRARDREAGGPGKFERGRFLESLPAELHGLAVALYAERDLELDLSRAARGVDQCLLSLEVSRLEEEIEFNASEQKEAEAAGDRAKVAQLAQLERDLHAARNSIKQRREAVSNLASPGGHQ
jgi:hypothetical protein